MTQSFAELHERLMRSSDDEQFELWNQIFTEFLRAPYNSTVDLSELVKSDEIALQISLCRFLALKEHEKAVQLLCKLMLSTNRIVEERAMKSFLRSKFSEKNRILVTLLVPTTPKISLLFAIENTCSNGVTEALIPLLDMLALKSTPIEIIEKILQSLRHIPDKRLWNSLQPYLHHSHEPYRFYTLGVLGSMYERGFFRARKHLLCSHTDESSRIRQTTIWILRRKPKLRDERLLWKIIYTDKDPQVRQEAILGLVNFPSHRNIVRLIELFKSDSESIVHLKIQALLLALPAKTVVASLRKILDSNTTDLKPIALKLFVYFEQDINHALKYLQKLYKKTSSDKHKIHIIETVGSLKSKSAYLWLEDLIHASPLISYTAMSAMVRVWANAKHFPVLKYLDDKSLSEPVKQIALKHFVKTSHHDDYNQDVVDHLVQLLNNEQLNVRYLASTGLAKSNNKSIFIPFVLSLLSETDPTAIKLLKHSIISMIKEYPHKTVPLLAKVSSLQHAQESILQLLVEAHYSREQIIEIWKPLLEVFSGEAIVANMNKISLLVLPLIRNQHLNLEDLLIPIQSDMIKHLFISTLLLQLKSDHKTRITLPVNYFENKLRSQLIIHDFELELLRYTSGKETVSILTKILCAPYLSDLHKQCSNLINEFIHRQEAA